MKLSSQELSTNTLAPEILALAVQLVKMDGYVVLEDVLPPELVADLYAAFMERFELVTATTEPNRGANRYQMHLPFEQPFIDPLVITNPLALPVIDAILGPNCVCHYFASDTPLPGSEYQRVHSDIHPLFADEGLIVPAYGLVLNIPLVDFREDNGPVEIWPGGTHLMPQGLDMQSLAENMYSEKVIMPAGSLLIRDLRMWHRGTPNQSDAARPNMAMIYARHWLKTSYPPIGIAEQTYDDLSERAKQLFRFENIGG